MGAVAGANSRNKSIPCTLFTTSEPLSGSVAGRKDARREPEQKLDFCGLAAATGNPCRSDTYRVMGATTPIPLLEGAEANGASGGKHTAEVRRVENLHLTMGHNIRASWLARLG